MILFLGGDMKSSLIIQSLFQRGFLELMEAIKYEAFLYLHWMNPEMKEHL